MRNALVTVAVAVSLVFPAAALAQVTVQYDSGNTGNTIVFTQNHGNEFTMLGASMTITQVTIFAYNADSVFNINFAQGVGQPIFTMGQIVGGSGTGFRTLAGLSVMFTGTNVWVGGNAYNSQGAAFDTVSMGFGFHGVQLAGTADTFGGNPGNYVLRITGPAGLPVELVNFKIKQK